MGYAKRAKMSCSRLGGRIELGSAAKGAGKSSKKSPLTRWPKGFSENESRDDKTAIELFLLGIAGLGSTARKVRLIE
jgi:hypothetical protein